MKKALTLSGILLAVALCVCGALAAGEALVSLSYLEGTFTQSVDAAVDSRLDSADQALREKLRRRLEAMDAALQAADGQQIAATPQEVTLKTGDALIAVTGSQVLSLGGQVRLSLAQGAVVDVTDGVELPDGSVLPTGHRCLAAENTVAYFTVLSPTAVVSYAGGYAFALSTDTPDYYAMACALRELGLFRGTGSGMGQGFDLHLAPNRGEALVMFIRILGEEEAALTCSYTHPFTDVPAWLDPYVAWAWQHGYTNGVSASAFAPAQTVSAPEYMEFLLRALGYSVAGVHDYLTSPERALACGAITQGELDMLRTQPFLRAQVAYLSYYALDAVLSGSPQTLGQRLAGQGLFPAQALDLAREMVPSDRLG